MAENAKGLATVLVLEAGDFAAAEDAAEGKLSLRHGHLDGAHQTATAQHSMPARKRRHRRTARDADHALIVRRSWRVVRGVGEFRKETLRSLLHRLELLLHVREIGGGGGEVRV